MSGSWISGKEVHFMSSYVSSENLFLVNYYYEKDNSLTSKKILEFFSNLLKTSPFIWRIGVKFYGVKSFDPNKLKFRTSDSKFVAGLLPSCLYEIVFDAQCLQTQSLNRGIGRYSLKLIQAICDARPDRSFAAVLTTVTTSAELAFAQIALESLECANLDIVILDPFNGKKKILMTGAQHYFLSELEKFECDSIITLSAFQKPESVIALPRLISSKHKKVAILFDLIPLQFPSYMLISNWQKTSYEWALANLDGCDLLLSISEESREHYFNLVSSDAQIEVIYGGVDARSSKEQKKFEERTGILCVGGEQPHKNIERLIEAYIALPKKVQLEIPRYLDEDELTGAYENARLLVMPSLVEGLSLPILEAWSNGLVAIGGVNTVAEELIADDSLLFNPTDALSMAECMNRLLNSEVEWNKGLEGSVHRSETFTWRGTAEMALDAIGSIKTE